MFDSSDFIRPGMHATVTKTVEQADTAADYGGGYLSNLLATPAYVDLIIRAAIDAIDPHLPPDYISIGQFMEFTHNAPTGLGMTVQVKATVKDLSGNHVTFDIVAWDDLGEIGFGRHERVIINRELMLKKANERISNLPVN